MELKEYLGNVDILVEQKKFSDLTKYQYMFMNNVLSEYNDKVQSTNDPITKDARIVIYDLLQYAVYHSETGNSIQYLDSDGEEIADRIDDIIMQDIGDYLLDYIIYDEDDKWVIDLMFCGAFIPDWDGWKE